ncbi:Non-specific serine/threonine protein kinase protein [Dioscorea alata]|uniref:Non-specific serine/threonine protein kinase protein n=1 Tax=Dioscorea alata TaxID=55571 RepID=A0ACB7U9X7_DIOAL|nr:Non-specific serine/threonine protein kinase protein [Dioscorea alata]
MPQSDPRFFTSSSRKHDFRGSPGLPSQSDISQSSNYNKRSLSTSGKKFPSTKAFQNSVRGAARTFIMWLVPACGKSGEEAALHDRNIPENDVSSTSISRISGSRSSPANFHYSGPYGTKTSYSTSDLSQETTTFSIAEIYKATGNFSADNIIGQGGTGQVYKGKLRDGTLIAVKRAKRNMSDKRLSKEFKNEMQTLSKVEHLNLVRFLGFLEQGDERLIVVEYVGNGTLREHLDGSRGNGLEIAQRLEIAIGVCHAITYLHAYSDHPIIHRDIKASNILLTETLRAKVADFGFARLGPEDPDATHISTQIKGTAGYVDPEYLRTYQLTEKSDVYSFGVLLVELVTGRHPIERHRDLKDRFTTRWALQKFKQGDTVLAMDPRMRRNPAAIMAVEKMMALGRECLAPTRKARPSMKQCGEILWRIRKDYREMQMQASPSPSPSASHWATPQQSSQATTHLPPQSPLSSINKKIIK